jgi:hypothetical protein
MKRILELAVVLAASQAFATASAQPAPECRPTEVPKDCVKEGGVPPWNGGYLEGLGLERLHFEFVDPAKAAFPPEGAVLKSVDPCGKIAPVEATVQDCNFETRGSAACLVNFKNGPKDGICSNKKEDNKRGVVAVRGYWDGTGKFVNDAKTVTFSCSAGAGIAQTPDFDGAIATCLTYGYYPKTHEDLFLACIRAMRADYCGDGFPRTLSRTEVRAYDPDLHKMTENQCGDGKLSYEGTWSREGAVCLDHTRWNAVSMSESACKDSFAAANADGLRCWKGTPARKAVLSTRSRCNVCPQSELSDQTDCPPPDKDPACKVTSKVSKTSKRPKK